jgi:hypothetical protein
MKNKKHDTEHFHNLDKLLISTVTQGSNPMKHDTAWTLPQSRQTPNIYCHPGFKPHETSHWTLPQSRQTPNIYCHPGFKPHETWHCLNTSTI